MPASSGAERRLLGLGLLAGVVVGAVWVAGRARHVADQPTPTLINWDRVRAMATSMNRESSADRAHLETLGRYYNGLVTRCVPLIAQFTGQTLPRQLDTVYVFGRNDWVRANIDNFRQLFEPVEAMNRRQGGLPGGVMWST